MPLVGWLVAKPKLLDCASYSCCVIGLLDCKHARLTSCNDTIRLDVGRWCLSAKELVLLLPHHLHIIYIHTYKPYHGSEQFDIWIVFLQGGPTKMKPTYIFVCKI